MKKLFVAVFLVFTVLLEVDVIDAFAVDYDYYQDGFNNRALRKVRDVDLLDGDMEHNLPVGEQNNELEDVEQVKANAPAEQDDLEQKQQEFVNAVQQELYAAPAPVALDPQDEEQNVALVRVEVKPDVADAPAGDVPLKEDEAAVAANDPEVVEENQQADGVSSSTYLPVVVNEAEAGKGNDPVLADDQVQAENQAQADDQPQAENQAQADEQVQAENLPQAENQAQADDQPQAENQAQADVQVRSDDEAEPEERGGPYTVPPIYPGDLKSSPLYQEQTAPLSSPQKRSAFRYRRAQNDVNVPDWERRDFNMETQALIRLIRGIFSDEEDKLLSERFYRDESSQDAAEVPPAVLEGSNQQAGEQTKWTQNLRVARDPPEDVGGLELARLVRSILIGSRRFDGTDGTGDGGDHGSGHNGRRIYF